MVLKSMGTHIENTANTTEVRLFQVLDRDLDYLVFGGTYELLELGV